MTKKTKMFVMLGTLIFVMTVFLISTQSYFNNKEIGLANDGCPEIGGIPDLQSSFLNLTYSFSCDTSN
ncbi:hypothetical protein DVB69_11020 [Sporosarcina sp. BI001-red]|uniref:hypothetical protein n=1 Tax=Sporosarcina sp. BI001-red TaxID=2282866 RepID=UPI000E23CB2E|nr:hypothetical protein [Sporosarcina sp. BI001-red]REB07357.1 hypothetical protein DVB69_11020 [Sporosarcina sp. BI001-red]